MAIITIFSGSFCLEEQVVPLLTELTGYQHLTDEDIVNKAATLSGEPADKIRQAFCGNDNQFNSFASEKEKSIAYLRLATADSLSQAPFILSGHTSLLITKNIKHAVKVCLIANNTFRQAQATKQLQTTEKDALTHIVSDNEIKAAWSQYLHGTSDPWNPSLYDMVLPMDKTTPQSAADFIVNTVSQVSRISENSIHASVSDFELSAVIQTKLVLVGHNVDVSSRNGHVNISVNKPVLMRARLEDELRSLTQNIPAVKQVTIQFKPSENDPLSTTNHPSSPFSRLLLVDDEREFVQTLSERLQMRQMESEAVYDGEAALECVEKDDPEVMIIDLKMPGIDGIEVLRRVKQTRPEIEVIVLTGHGSEQDKSTCMSLGAFAYLQKPVDFDLLNQTLKAADEKIKRYK